MFSVAPQACVWTIVTIDNGKQKMPLEIILYMALNTKVDPSQKIQL